MPSSTMIRMPKTLRMISGRKRRYSAPCGRKLSSIPHLRHTALLRGHQVYAILITHLALVENARSCRGNWREKRLRATAQPDHQDNERCERYPVGCRQIGELRH